MERINWKITLAYDGTEFHGWQVQRDHSASAAPTIQGTLAAAIEAVTGERVLPQGSGRTDAGVHAAGQVASVALGAPIPAENFRRALDRVLPPAIRILAAEPAVADFHARHSAVAKIYRYRIFQGRVCSPFLARYVACSRQPLDLAAMQAAAEAVLGEHNFSSFAAFDPDRAARLRQRETGDGNLRRIDRSEWRLEPVPFCCAYPFAEQDCTGDAGQVFTYTVRGNGFLHHMVRNLVGTFVEIGRGRLAPGAMVEILRGRNRALAGPTAPASGLCLMEVLY